jgi:ketosteroid isomerase-like protein
MIRVAEWQACHMTEHTAVEVVLAALAAVEERDGDSLASLCHPGVSFHWPPSLPYGGVATGRRAARSDLGWSSYWTPLQPTPEERRLDPRVVAATDREVVVLWHQRGLAQSGERIDCEVLGLYNVTRGLLARAQMFHFDPLSVQQFLETNTVRGS